MTRSFNVLVWLALLASACNEPPPADRVHASGHVEATETRLAPEQGGRVLTLTIKEGDRVERGQVILTLDKRDLELALQRARADQAQAEAQLRLVQAGSRVEDIRQAESQLAAAQADASAAGANSGRPSRTSNASRCCSPTTPALRSSATMPRRGNRWPPTG